MWGSLLGVEATEALSGGAGWVGTGLLGSVLMWLFFRHLPDKDRQLKEFNDASNARFKEIMDAKDTQINGIINSHNALLAEQVSRLAEADRDRRSDFKAALDVVIDHCQREAVMQRDVLAKDLSENVEAIKDLRLTMEELRKVFLDRNSVIIHPQNRTS